MYMKYVWEGDMSAVCDILDNSKKVYTDYYLDIIMAHTMETQLKLRVAQCPQ